MQRKQSWTLTVAFHLAWANRPKRVGFRVASKALRSGWSQFQPGAHPWWQALTSSAAPTARRRALTLPTAARALENQPVTSGVLELSVPELRTGGCNPRCGPSSVRLRPSHMLPYPSHRCLQESFFAPLRSVCARKRSAGWEGGVGVPQPCWGDGQIPHPHPSGLPALGLVSWRLSEPVVVRAAVVV